MKITISHLHGIIIIPFLLLLLVPEVTIPAGAQPGSNQANGNLYSYGTFSPSLAIIIAVIITSLFCMVFFFVYIRQCSGRNSASLPVNVRGHRVVALGLDRSIIETFPTFTYSEVKEHKINVDGGLECAVCLNEFEDDETLRMIPKCDHVFHPECIDAWLGSHVTCPVCRANLVPQPGDEPIRVPDLTTNDIVERSRSRNSEILIQVVDESQSQERHGHINRNMSFGNLNRLARSWSLGPKRFGLGKFRSFSTGHSLVQPEENLNRFTLRLPANIRKEMINRTSLNVAMLPKEGSSRKGYRLWTGGEGSNRSDERIDRSDRRVKSDRWAFFARALSMKSPRVSEMDKSFDSDTKRDETGTQTN